MRKNAAARQLTSDQVIAFRQVVSRATWCPPTNGMRIDFFTFP